MNAYVFHRAGYDSSTVLVRAETETEARGKAQKEVAGGLLPKYKGQLSELFNEDESDVLQL